MDEIEERLARVEARVKQLEKGLEDELEERRRAMGRISRAADQLRSTLTRLEALEGEHRQLATNVQMGGMAMITASPEC